MSRSKLIVMCGLSGSGKSTIAKNLAEDMGNTVIVSSDGTREEVFGNYEDTDHNADVFRIYHERIKNALENNHNVIADATNLTMKSRRATLENIKGMDIERMCYIVPKPFEQCKVDNQDREHPVSDEVLDKQIRRFQIPYREEGWDHIEIHETNHWDGYKLSGLQLYMTMYDFDQMNPHHNSTLDKHCKNVSDMFMDLRPSNMLFGTYLVDEFVMGALLHDIGKLSVQTFDNNGVAHYLYHSEVGAYTVLTQMKLPLVWYDQMLLNCCFLINYHMLPFGWEKATEKTKQRWKKRFGEYKYQMLLDFHKCDIAR